jgi:uncharacterized membrane protein YcaP (DUF421 family)
MNVDWAKLFLPTTPLLEIIIRGSITYLALFAILRLVHKRQSGTVGVTDLLVLVLIADAIQNAMSGGYESITDGIILVSVIVFWSYALDWLGFRFPFLQRLIHPSSLMLVKNGEMLRRNMRRELITEDELRTALRKNGVSDLKRVKAAYMESDGQISVIPVEESTDDSPKHPMTP